MGKLSTAARKKLPSSAFALPGRRFPLTDASHDRAAERDAPRALHAGSITPAEEHAVQRKAAAKLAGMKQPSRANPRRGR